MGMLEEQVKEERDWLESFFIRKDKSIAYVKSTVLDVSLLCVFGKEVAHSVAAVSSVPER